jgi:hypothetical protein
MMHTSRPRMIVVILACCAALAACSGGGSPTVSSSAPTQVAGGSSTGAPAPSTPAATGGTAASLLDGTWDGTWRSAGQSGTFSISWTETGSTLDGTLSISVPCLDGANITGTVNGGSIQFGSVKGQCQVDYSGSINGDQMSGTYNLSGAAGGTWKATKA